MSTQSDPTIDPGALASRLAGRVITPDDAGYEEGRTPFYGGIDRRPSLIVEAADAADVARVVTTARESGLELAIRSGGHSVAAHSTTDGGIILDLRRLNGLDIDAAGRTAWTQTGLTAGEYTVATAEHGLATGFGDTASVGIGGITLGGGVGYLARKHGLTIDSLLAAEIVTADGDLLHIDETSHPDLFWAIRGGGGNFGVATRFRFRLHSVSEVIGGMMALPATADVIAGFVAEATAAPDELSTIANVMVAPPAPFIPEELHGRLVLLALMAWSGEPNVGARVVARIRDLAEPLVDMVGPTPYPGLFPPEDPEFHPSAVGRTMFVDSVDRPVADTVLEHLASSDAPVRVAQLRVLGGAIARVPVDATAYAHRNSRIMLNVAAFYDGPEDFARREAWVVDFAAAMQQGDTGAYIGFLGDEGPERTRAAYPGETWERLRAVKARYDPTNLFRLNHNIPPA